MRKIRPSERVAFLLVLNNIRIFVPCKKIWEGYLHSTMAKKG
jgi:hypothetical protein